jgi:hypothetical protein
LKKFCIFYSWNMTLPEMGSFRPSIAAPMKEGQPQEKVGLTAKMALVESHEDNNLLDAVGA